MSDRWMGHQHGHANTWYLEAIQGVMARGDKVTTRGRTTWEILHSITKLPEPRKRVLTVPFRRANPFFQALETVWILAGRSDAAWLTYYNSQMAKFLDDYETGPGWVAGDIKKHEYFHGAYGERLRHWGQHQKSGIVECYTHDDGGWWGNQIQLVITQLLAEASSRRAAMVIHNPLLDNPHKPTLDRPCNIAMTYQLRKGQLHGVTFNRSNDLNLGLAFTNICQFTTIQEFIAAALGVDVGDYVHFSSSLHVYEDDPIVQHLVAINKLPTHHDCGPSVVKEMIRRSDALDFDVYDYVEPTPMKRWETADEGWRVVQTLEAMGSQSQGPLFPSMKFECPYWFSVVCMTNAWHALKRDDPANTAVQAALHHVDKMPAKDWQIACAEFLHRWACKRGVRADFAVGLAKSEMIKSWAGPVGDFVIHDKGDNT